MNKYLVITFALGALIRIVCFDSIPMTNRDELSIGYNAYSVVTTGLDEHGAGPWPISFKAFGEYKLPGLIYLVMPFVKAFGLNMASIRLPNLIFGILLIPFTYWLSQTYFKRRDFSFFATIFIATAYWHIHASRSAFEPTIALTLSCLYLILLPKVSSLKFACLGWLIAVASMLTYNSHIVLLPLFALAWVTINTLILKKFQWKLACFFLGVSVLALISWNLLSGVNASRLNTTVFNNLALKHQAVKQAVLLENENYPRKIVVLVMKGWHLMASTAIKNYFVSINPYYIFGIGDDNPWHNFRSIGFGNLNIALLPLIILGIFQIIKHDRKKIPQMFLLVVTFLSPLMSAITVDAPVTNRLFEFHFFLVLLAAYGLVSISNLNIRKILIGIYALLFLVFSIKYFSYINDNNHPLWSNGFPEVVSKLKQFESSYDAIYVDPSVTAGGNTYVYFAFFRPYDPAYLRSSIQRKSEGMNLVTKLDKYVFDRPMDDARNYLYVKPYNGNNESSSNSLFTQKNDRGQILWEVLTR